MRVRLTRQAEADLDRIAAYIHERSPQGAVRVEAEVRSALRLIGSFPFAGSLQRRGSRQFAIARYPYLIFYDVDEKASEVQVLTIRHASRRRPEPR